MILGKTVNSLARRFFVAGVFAVAAAAAPTLAATMSTGVAADTLAGPACLAWMGNKEDGNCVSYSNGQPINAGTPYFGIDGNNGNGVGITTGPLLPGTTINRGIR